jgi:gluconolactonase
MISDRECGMEREVFDAAFSRLVAADVTIERIAAGFAWAEGPVWVGDRLLFSDVIRNRIACWRELPEGPELTTFRYPSSLPLDEPVRVHEPGSNGLTLDRQGRLLAAEHGLRRVSRTERDGTIVTLADRWQGRRLNSPNDLIVRSDGTVYFSDPSYGLKPLREALQELPFQAVYRIDPAGRLSLLADDFEGPNGLALSPDERTLYVADSVRHHVRAFAVAADGGISGGRLVVEVRAADGSDGHADGLKVDREGNLWCGTVDGLRVYAPNGSALGLIPVPERVANLAWGGPDWRTLYLTATTSLYRLPTLVAGIPVG